MEPSFNICALEVLVTQEIMDVVVAVAEAKAVAEWEVKVGKEDIAEERPTTKVVVNREVTTKEGPAIEGAIQELAVGRLPDGAGKETKTTKATPEDEAS